MVNTEVLAILGPTDVILFFPPEKCHPHACDAAHHYVPAPNPSAS